MQTLIARIRWRLVGWNILILGLILTLAGAGVYAAASRSLLGEVDSALITRSEQAVPILFPGPRRDDFGQSSTGPAPQQQQGQGGPVGGPGRRFCEGYSGGMFCIALSPDGAAILTVGGKVAWLRQTTKRGQIASSLELPHPHEIAIAAFSPDGRLVLTVCDHGTARLWDTAHGGLARVLDEKAAGPVEVAAFALSGQTVATGHPDGKVRLWDTSTGKLKDTVWADYHDVPSVAFSPDGGRLATIGRDDKVNAWDAQSGREILVFGDIRWSCPQQIRKG